MRPLRWFAWLFVLAVGCGTPPPPLSPDAPVPKTEIRKTKDGKEEVVTSLP